MNYAHPGNVRVDRPDNSSVSFAEISYDVCYDNMKNIYNHCGGYGGWVDTGFGTVSFYSLTN